MVRWATLALACLLMAPEVRQGLLSPSSNPAAPPLLASLIVSLTHLLPAQPDGAASTERVEEGDGEEGGGARSLVCLLALLP
ncbi:hypothetical protein T484DRAFT_1771169 [Baffinella frigidus]|nr:hypothetical protein T484DRAFT_1771169 [Cryptophyta sp. CCMP2293]